VFKKKYDQEPDIYAASAFDALNILASAMERGGFNSELIKETLYSIQDFPGVTGLTSFDKNGDVNKPIGIKKVENGKFVWVSHGF
jgi:branched-chain amino acid transport system substrate-binding protein